MSYYKPGTWNVICQLCGVQFKSDQIRKRWDGLMVCESDYETRHILDFIKPTTDQVSVPFTSPEPADNFVQVFSYESRQGIADIGAADFAQTNIVYNNVP